MRPSLLSPAMAFVCGAVLAAHAAAASPTTGAVSEPEVSAATPSTATLSAMATARLAAAGDGLSTYAVLQGAARERNPLVNVTPAGLVALTAVKFGLLEYMNTRPEAQRRAALKAYTAIWGGAMVNNLLLKYALTGSPVLFGIAAGYLLWQHEDKVLAEEASARQAAGASKPAST